MPDLFAQLLLDSTRNPWLHRFHDEDEAMPEVRNESEGSQDEVPAMRLRVLRREGCDVLLKRLQGQSVPTEETEGRQVCQQ